VSAAKRLTKEGFAHLAALADALVSSLVRERTLNSCATAAESEAFGARAERVADAIAVKNVVAGRALMQRAQVVARVATVVAILLATALNKTRRWYSMMVSLTVIHLRLHPAHSQRRGHHRIRRHAVTVAHRRGRHLWCPHTRMGTRGARLIGHGHQQAGCVVPTSDIIHGSLAL
jgi:hypothetical protein